jgi:hypothetical protein
MGVCAKVVNLLAWGNFVIVGTLGSVAMITLWWLFADALIVSIPGIAGHLHDADAPVPLAGIAFTSDDFKGIIKDLRGVGFAYNVFGWVMFAVAWFTIGAMIIGGACCLYTKFVGREVQQIRGWTRIVAWIPIVIALITPMLMAIAGIIHTIAYMGFLVSAGGLRIGAFRTLLHKDAYCENQGISGWNRTIANCGPVLDFDDLSDRSPDADCCTGNQLCCAFDAPYDWGLKGVGSDPLAGASLYANGQNSLRPLKGAVETITRMDYIEHTLYANIGQNLYAEHTGAEVFIARELWIVILGALTILLYAQLYIKLIPIYKTLVEAISIGPASPASEGGIEMGEVGDAADAPPKPPRRGSSADIATALAAFGAGVFAPASRRQRYVRVATN